MPSLSIARWIFAGTTAAEAAQLKAMVAALKYKGAKKQKQKQKNLHPGKLPG